MKSALKWDVFVSSQIAAVTGDLPPGVTEMKWSPISSTLISGERDAVLVDTFITLEQNRALAEWVVASGKNLTTIYATHGHPVPLCELRGYLPSDLQAGRGLASAVHTDEASACSRR